MHLLHIYVFYISSCASSLSKVEEKIYLIYLLFSGPPVTEKK